MRRGYEIRTTRWQKIRYVITPFFLYMIVKSVAMFVLSMCVSIIPGTGVAEWVLANSNMLSAVINAVASLIGMGFVMNDFLIEVVITGEYDMDAPVLKRVAAWIGEGWRQSKGRRYLYVLTMLLAVSSALAMNIVITLFSIDSVKYDNVEAIQYSVPIWLGLILYGVVSPVVEEVIFRGLTYNRMKHYFKLWISIVVSAVIFGGFHANIPQVLYGTIMGVLITLCYEWVRGFGAPLLFHMIANIFVFLFSTVSLSEAVYGILVSPITAVLLVIISVGLLWLIWKKRQREIRV